MEQFVRLEGIAAPLLRINIDTDQIIPAKYLVRVSYAGIGQGLFAGWRLRPDGSPDPEFILNRAPWTQSTILLADRNFGCGSSREGAPKALRDWGIRSVIAPSFGGIFFNNCFRNGIVPVELPIEQVRSIAREVESSAGKGLTVVDLQKQTVTAPQGEVFAFHTPAQLRRMLLEGLDEVDLTLTMSAQIERFRSADRIKRPWAYRSRV
ncbi:MAG: 3-isopropylmalate dehydratase small subunit [Pseudomonadota bacterium]